MEKQIASKADVVSLLTKIYGVAKPEMVAKTDHWMAQGRKRRELLHDVTFYAEDSSVWLRDGGRLFKQVIDTVSSGSAHAASGSFGDIAERISEVFGSPAELSPAAVLDQMWSTAIDDVSVSSGLHGVMEVVDKVYLEDRPHALWHQLVDTLEKVDTDSVNDLLQRGADKRESKLKSAFEKETLINFVAREAGIDRDNLKDFVDRAAEEDWAKAANVVVDELERHGVSPGDAAQARASVAVLSEIGQLVEGKKNSSEALVKSTRDLFLVVDPSIKGTVTDSALKLMVDLAKPNATLDGALLKKINLDRPTVDNFRDSLKSGVASDVMGAAQRIVEKVGGQRESESCTACYQHCHHTGDPRF